MTRVTLTTAVVLVAIFSAILFGFVSSTRNAHLYGSDDGQSKPENLKLLSSSVEDISYPCGNNLCPEWGQNVQDSGDLKELSMRSHATWFSSTKIPLIERIKFGKESDLSEFFRKFVKNSTMGTPNKHPGKPWRGRGRSSHHAKPVTVSKNVCHPMPTTVQVPAKVKPTFKIVPRCVSIQRCGGCCNDETHVCEPTKFKNVTREIRLLEYIGNSFFVEKELKHFTFIEDTECACNCRTKKEHCTNPLHIYVPEICSCFCGNTKEQEACQESADHIWNNEECMCECREKGKECSSGHFYDHKSSCQCLRVVETDSEAEDDIEFIE